jgi:microcystin-dependent protein
MVGDNGTVMTTVATCPLNMNADGNKTDWYSSNNVVNIPKLPLPKPYGAADWPTSPDSGAPALLAGMAVNYAQITNMVYLMSLMTTPIGTIQAYGGTSLPDGWKWCDGTEYNYATLPEMLRLYTAIDTAFGTSGGTTFSVPDLKGTFLRGAQTSGAGRDPDYASRTQSKAGGATGGSGVGTFQGHSISNHTHNVTIAHNATWNNISGGAGGADSAMIVQNSVQINGTLDHTPTTVNGGGTSAETRPGNVAVNYIIRYK